MQIEMAALSADLPCGFAKSAKSTLRNPQAPCLDGERWPPANAPRRMSPPRERRGPQRWTPKGPLQGSAHVTWMRYEHFDSKTVAHLWENIGSK